MILVQVLEDGASECLYLASVLFTKEVKKGPLSETSPMINDISSVHAWEKVCPRGWLGILFEALLYAVVT